MPLDIMKLVSYGIQDRYLIAMCKYCEKYKRNHKILCRNDQNKIHNEFLFHTMICDYIEQFIKHIHINNLYDESVVNDIFKYNELKNIMSEYNQILFDVSIDEQHIELGTRMLQFYRNFILIFTGEDIDKQSCNYPNDHKYCYLDHYENENYKNLVLYGYSIYTITQLKKLKN